MTDINEIIETWRGYVRFIRVNGAEARRQGFLEEAARLDGIAEGMEACADSLAKVLSLSSPQTPS